MTRFHFMTQSLIAVPDFFRHLDTILYKTRWDTCSTNHQKIRNKVVCVQNDMYDSISMF